LGRGVREVGRKNITYIEEKTVSLRETKTILENIRYDECQKLSGIRIEKTASGLTNVKSNMHSVYSVYFNSRSK